MFIFTSLSPAGNAVEIRFLYLAEVILVLLFPKHVRMQTYNDKMLCIFECNIKNLLKKSIEVSTYTR